VKFLIAGLGSIGRRHLRNLISLGETDIVLYRTRKSTLPDEELGRFPQEMHLREALSKHKPDAVIVANPTAFHLDVALPAAETGSAILLEKPVSHSMDGLDVFRAAVQRAGSKVLVGFQFRFHPGLLRAREAIAAGVIGRIISGHVHFGEYLPDWHPWEDYRGSYAARAEMGGGVVLTQCHALDYLPWLLGGVESAWAFTAKLSDLDVNVEDTAEIGLRFQGGALGSLHLDFNQQPPSHHLEIIGTEGSLRSDLADGATRIYSPREKRWHSHSPPSGWDRNAMFLDEMRHFIAVARGEVQPSASLKDGLRLQYLVEAVMRSSRARCLIELKDFNAAG